MSLVKLHLPPLKNAYQTFIKCIKAVVNSAMKVHMSTYHDTTICTEEKFIKSLCPHCCKPQAYCSSCERQLLAHYYCTKAYSKNTTVIMFIVFPYKCHWKKRLNNIIILGKDIIVQIYAPSRNGSYLHFIWFCCLFSFYFKKVFTYQFNGLYRVSLKHFFQPLFIRGHFSTLVTLSWHWLHIVTM